MASTNQNQTFTATFPSNGRTVNGRTMGRIIGIGGCGTKRLAAEVRTRFQGSRPFLRGDRETGLFTISAKGTNGSAAVRWIAANLQKELDWASGSSADCPHPHKWVNAEQWRSVLKHIIGRGGQGLKDMTKGEKGAFVIARERDGKKFLLVEGMDNSQVGRVVLKLRAAANKTVAEQNRRPTQVDLNRQSSEDDAVIRAAEERLQRMAGGGRWEAPSTNGAAGASTDGVETNSFGALQDSSSGSESEDEESDSGDSGVTRKVEAELRAHLLSSGGGASAQSSLGREMHQARCQIAEAKGLENPKFVSDKEVNAFLRSLAEEEDLETARRQPAEQTAVDTSSREEFPTCQDVTDNNASKSLAEGMVASVLSEEPRVTLEVKEPSCWGKGKTAAQVFAAPAPPAPPMPTGGLLMRQQSCMSATHETSSWPKVPRMARQFTERAPPQPTLSRSESAVPAQPTEVDRSAWGEPTGFENMADTTALSPLPRLSGQNQGTRSWDSESDDE